jgi:hypothetical protein
MGPGFYHLGRERGRAWARDEATRRQLWSMAEWRAQARMCSKNEYDYLSAHLLHVQENDPGMHLGRLVIEQCEGGVSLGGDGDKATSYFFGCFHRHAEYLGGFCDGAMEVWDGIKNHL